MSDQELRIRVAAETGAAQDALGRLSEEMAGLAKATDGAGKEQKTLAKQTGETVAATQRAREAVERLKRAQAEAAAIAHAFGKDSAEAAAAQQRLRAAQDAATRAARDSEKALEANAKAVADAARSADTKAAPGIRRMGDALQRAGKEAEKVATDLRTLDARMQATGKAAQDLNVSTKTGGDSISMLGSLASKAGPLLGAGALAAGAMAAASALREMSAETMAFETAMANLPFGLEAARKATKGLVNDQQLAQSAAQGLALGVVKTEDEFARLAEAATKLGIKLGIGPSQALDNMMTALGRGSTEILDNLGVVLKAGDANDRYARSIGKTSDELTDAEKKVAFKTEAIRALTEAADATIIKTDSAAAAIQRMGVRADNTKASAEGLAVELAGSLVQAMERLEEGIPGAEKFNDHLDERMEKERAYVNMMALQEKATRAQAAAEAAYADSIDARLNMGYRRDADGYLQMVRRDMNEEELAQMKALGQAAYDNANTFGTLDGELLQHWETVKGFTASIWGQADAYAQATKAARDHAEAQKVADDAMWKKLEERNRKAEDAALEAAFFAENEMGPALPPGFKRSEKKKAKKPKDLRMGRHEFDTEIADFAFETTQSVRKADREAEIKAYEAESAMREQRLAGLQREMEMLEAKGGLERERVDFVFYELEVANTAADQRDALIDRQIDKELDLARWQAKNAKTEEQRERALTRLTAAEHKKRVADLEKSVAAEEKEHARKRRAVETVFGAVTTLADGMIGAFEAMAAGEKGAMAKMLADLLKGVAKKHAILALGETAQGVAATAATFGIVNPKAAAHFAAAGLHAGVAIAAGAGAVAAGKVWESQRGNPEEDKWAEQQATKERKEAWKEANGLGGSSGGGSSNGSASGTSNPRGGSDEGLEAQMVPISHEQLRRHDRHASSGTGGAQVNIYGTVNVYGAGGKQEFIEDIRRGLDRQDRAGRRARI